MRRHAVLLTGVAVMFAGALVWAGQGTADDAKDLDESLEAYVAGFNAHDAKAVAALYTEDADVVLPTGGRQKGRAAIEKGLAEDFAANPGLKITLSVASRRFIKPDVVMEDGTWKESGLTRQGLATQGLYAAVLVKQRETWLILCERGMVPVNEAGAGKPSEKR